MPDTLKVPGISEKLLEAEMKFQKIQLIMFILFVTTIKIVNAQQLIVSVDPQSTSTEINQTVSLNIIIENVNNLGGFQFDIFYNSQIVQSNGATIGDLMGSSGRTPLPLGPEIDNNASPGKITFGGATLGSGAGANGNGILAIIEFTTLAGGNSGIDLQNVQVSDVSGQSLNINSINDGEINVLGGNVNEIVVTNTNDGNEGSLRWALDQANSQTGPNRIIFNIPQIDANYNAVNGVWTIRPQNTLPEISDSNLVIDGNSQSAFIGLDTNPDGPEIVINGSEIAGWSFLLKVISSHNTISSLIINGIYGNGIWLSGDEANYNHIWGNYIGTNAVGTDTVPNTNGIYISEGSFNIIGGDSEELRNVISGNLQNGVFVTDQFAHGNHIMGNFIGTDATGTKDLGNGWMGIMMYSEVYENIIGGKHPGERNIISGNDNSGIRIAGFFNEIIGNYLGTDVTGTKAIGNEWAGLELWGGAFNIIGGTNQGEGNLLSGNAAVGIGFNDTDNNQVLGNYIGTQPGGTGSLGNGASGVALTSGSKNNQIGPRNIISNNGYAGVFFYADSTIQNKITQNSISNNYGPGIDYTNGGNMQLTSPSISYLSSGILSGTAPANSTIEIFSDSENEGKIYEGSTSASNSGNFQWNGTPSGPYLTATATDAEGNTSIFSPPCLLTFVEEKKNTTVPDHFYLKQNYPNPFNPETKIEYQLQKASDVEISIFNMHGQKISTLIKNFQTAGNYEVKWRGVDHSGNAVASGVYLYKITAGKIVAVKKMALLR